MDIIKKIITLCNERDWSTYDLAKESLLTHSTISSMLQRGAPPKLETLQRICDAFGITLSQFFLEEEKVEAIDEEEKVLIKLFREMSIEKRKALLDFLKLKK